jgi:uncharacterized protein YjbI with pentapeptide repeats
MVDNSKQPERKTGEPKPPKKEAEDNPWYLLATLYGVPEQENQALQDRNRIAWNRYFAANLDEETRARLVHERGPPAEELTPFSQEELLEVATAFAERCKAPAKELALQASDAKIDFSNVKFEQDAFFGRYLFSWTHFVGAAFSGVAHFVGATFSGPAVFDGATFSGVASFYGATFSGGVSFDGAAFSCEARFGGATFPDVATFQGTAFSSRADFGGAAFSGPAFFSGAAFSGGAFFRGAATFRGAAFSGGAYFIGATFSGRADFCKVTFGETTSFVNAEMKGETFFDGAIFDKAPPRFFNAKLHQGTVWRSVTWPSKPKDKDYAGAFIDAYACLKLEMDRLKKHEDELDFFALELQSRRVMLGPWWGWPIFLYGVLSGYGRIYVRPLVALFVVVAIGAWAFWYFDARTCGEALGLSAANTFNVFGFRRDFGLAIDTPLAWLTVLAAVQTILGTILLFLFGLGIRNKFRMK